MKINQKKASIEVLWSSVAILAGAIVIYLGAMLLDIRLELFYGMQTFNFMWMANLILIPILAGFLVTFIYGLGGKIIAHFPPLIVHGYAYFTLDYSLLPEHGMLFPVGYWILLVIVAVEAGAAGGLIGEIVIKRTYGRRPKELIHSRYQK